ncbi:hypothetical protein ACLB1O_04045 [Escherichia coli]
MQWALKNSDSRTLRVAATALEYGCILITDLSNSFVAVFTQQKIHRLP